MRPWIPILSLALLALVACGIDQPTVTASRQAALATSPVDLSEPGLYYFAGVVDGERSTLWWTDPADDDPARVRREVATVDHAPGYPARGAMNDDGSHVAWLRQPEGSRHHDPVELVLDGAVVDEAALYLQQPRFVGEALMYLRRWPGEPRLDERGRQVQALDGFDLVALEPGGAPRIVGRWDALWVQLDGVARPDPGLLVRVVEDAGPRLLELRPDGSAHPSPRYGDADPEQVVRGRVGGDRWEVSVGAVGDAVLWRVHGVDGLDFLLERSDGVRAQLVPDGDPAREVDILGQVR